MFDSTAEQYPQEQTAVQQPLSTTGTKPATKRLVSLESFLLRYSNREDPYKYEWNNGVVEKSLRTMNRDQTKILQQLLRLFAQTAAYANMGELLCEVDMLMATKSRTRRADIAYMSSAQIQASANGALTPCAFVVEVISKNDQINGVEKKLVEYFENGIQVVWVILPQLQQVKVYRSIRDITVCFDEDVCSAAPVLPDFEIAVNALFA